MVRRQPKKAARGGEGEAKGKITTKRIVCGGFNPHPKRRRPAHPGTHMQHARRHDGRKIRIKGKLKGKGRVNEKEGSK